MKRGQPRASSRQGTHHTRRVGSSPDAEGDQPWRRNKDPAALDFSSHAAARCWGSVGILTTAGGGGVSAVDGVPFAGRLDQRGRVGLCAWVGWVGGSTAYWALAKAVR